MGKYVIVLCASMYATLMIFGEGEDVNAIDEAALPQAEASEADSETNAAGFVQTTEAEPVATPEPAVIEVASTVVAPAVETVSLDASDVVAPELVSAAVETALSEPQPEPAVETASQGPIGEIWRVTGSRVNLRSGAGTAYGVVGRTVRGDSAEVVEMLENGWAKVYIIEQGLEAYMSASFIAPENG